jgi:hypothetical protein
MAAALQRASLSQPCHTNIQIPLNRAYVSRKTSANQVFKADRDHFVEE